MAAAALLLVAGLGVGGLFGAQQISVLQMSSRVTEMSSRESTTSEVKRLLSEVVVAPPWVRLISRGTAPSSGVGR